MPGFSRLGELIDAELEGRVREYIFRKTPSQATTTSIWFDLSMSPGMPVPKYWFDAAPLTAKAIYQSTDGGFYHGANVSPAQKHLRKITMQATGTSTTNISPMGCYLCDYLMYYPSIDDGTTDPQVMDNTVTLPRYTDGKGVMMTAVTIGARTGGQQFFVTYTNQDGVAGRITPTVTQNSYSALGTITHHNNQGTLGINGCGPFLPLQSGDTGVRLVESVTMLGLDVGLFSIVLVKPLDFFTMRECLTTTAGSVAVPHEKDFLISDGKASRIYDDAFLGMIVMPNGSLNTIVLRGTLKVIYN